MFLPPQHVPRDAEASSWSTAYFYNGTTLYSSARSVLTEKQGVLVQGDFPGVSFTESGGFFLRAGGASVSDSKDFDGGWTYTLGLGMRDVWKEWGGSRRYSDWSLGTVLQANAYGESDGDHTLPQGGVASASLKQQWDVSFAVLLQKRLEEWRALLYAGPFLQYGSMEVDMSVRNSGTSSESFNTGWSRALGVVVGARVEIVKSLAVVSEIQVTGDFSAGLMLQYAPPY